MKKTLIVAAVLSAFSFFAVAQSNVSVPVTDEIYEFLDVAQKKGLCSPLNSYKPYTKSQILESLRQINDNSEMMTEREAEIAEQYLSIYEPSEKEVKNNFWQVKSFLYHLI